MKNTVNYSTINHAAHSPRLDSDGVWRQTDDAYNSMVMCEDRKCRCCWMANSSDVCPECGGVYFSEV